MPVWWSFIQLVYVFSANVDNVPNFVVFRGSVGQPYNIDHPNWEDNYSPSTREEYITIENADTKGCSPKIKN